MNHEEILAMEAGIELDELVHREVMGIAKVSLTHPLPKYSIYISAAWSVVEKMTLLGYGMSLLLINHAPELYPEPYWYCDFRVRGSHAPPDYEWVDHHKTAPEAICKAALLAKLEEKG